MIARGRIFNVGDEIAYTEREWLGFVKDAAKWQGEIKVLPDADVPETFGLGGNPEHHIFADTRAIRHDLGYADPFNLATSLERTIAWERKNLATEPTDYTVEDAILNRM
ncbi:MAG: hypothetical protein ACR2OU_10555 [Thermomicrobiales bacterium]